MQNDQAEHLRQLIDSSTILSPEEKGEWLDMLILMNDKQAAELETILKAPKISAAIPPVASSPKPLPQGGMPSLSHISNLPAGFGVPARSVPPRPTPQPPVSPKSLPNMPWQKQFENTMAEKELSPSRSRPLPPLPTKTLSPVPQKLPRLSPQDRPSSPAQTSSARTTLETLTDAGSLTTASLRNMPNADLLVRLQQLSKMEGYFNLLSYLEDSPLYKSYIATGQKVLSSKSTFDISKTDPQLLTKPEFETFTDILRKIQIN